MAEIKKDEAAPRVALHKRPWAIPIMAGSVLAFVVLVWAVTIPERAPDSAPTAQATASPTVKPVRKLKNQKLTKAAKTYFATVERSLTQLRSGKDEIVAAHAALSKNPALLTDKTWRSQALSACHTLKGGVESVRTIHSSPEGAQDLTQSLYSLAGNGEAVYTQYELGTNRNEIVVLKFAATSGAMPTFQETLEAVPAQLAEVRSSYASH